MAYYIPPSEKVGGTRPRVPHQIAPIGFSHPMQSAHETRRNDMTLVAVHIVFGSHMRPCKPCALDLTIANAWVRF